MKRFRAVLVALLTLLFVVAPVLDSVLCSGEASAMLQTITLDADSDTPQPSDLLYHHVDCAHGHCHHFTPLAAAMMGEHSPEAAALKVGWLTSQLDSLDISSLERPPRA